MIRIIKKITYPIPAILASTGASATSVLMNRFENGERNFNGADFDKAIYGNDEVKEALIKIQGYKCCFCEAKIGHVSFGDIEHFRPKAGWVQDNESLNKPSYYCLAYEWDNLFLSCEKCNQRHKKNLFPLSNPEQRALSHNGNIAAEKPLFIHPTNDNPEDFIFFREEIPVGINSSARGRITITRLGLDR